MLCVTSAQKKIFKRFTNLVVQFFIFLAYKVFITFDGSMSLSSVSIDYLNIGHITSCFLIFVDVNFHFCPSFGQFVKTWCSLEHSTQYCLELSLYWTQRFKYFIRLIYSNN